jgi:hypothetical protein
MFSPNLDKNIGLIFLYLPKRKRRNMNKRKRRDKRNKKGRWKSLKRIHMVYHHQHHTLDHTPSYTPTSHPRMERPH